MAFVPGQLPAGWGTEARSGLGSPARAGRGAIGPHRQDRNRRTDARHCHEGADQATDRQEPTDPTLNTDPTDQALRAEPTDPTLRTDPTDPTLSTDPRLRIDRTECDDSAPHRAIVVEVAMLDGRTDVAGSRGLAATLTRCSGSRVVRGRCRQDRSG